jgi:hypothetical protein
MTKTESEERKEPDVVDAVGSGAVYTAGAGVENENESNSGDDEYEDANYYDPDSEYSNTAQDLKKTIMTNKL